MLLIAASGRARSRSTSAAARGAARARARPARRPIRELRATCGLYLQPPCARPRPTTPPARPTAARDARRAPSRLDLDRPGPARRRAGSTSNWATSRGPSSGSARRRPPCPSPTDSPMWSILQRAELEHELGTRRRRARAWPRRCARASRGGLIAAAGAPPGRAYPGSDPDREPIAAERLAEADLRLAEGDARGAQAEALVVLAARPTRETRDHALWIQARAAWSLGMREAAEALCLALATGDSGALQRPRAGAGRALALERRRRPRRAPALPRAGAPLPRQPRGAGSALRHRAHPPGGRRLRRSAAGLRRARRALSRHVVAPPTRAGARDGCATSSGDHAGAADRFRRLAPASDARHAHRRRVLGGARARERLATPRTHAPS